VLERAKKIISEFANDDLAKCRDFLIGKIKAAIVYMPDMTKEEIIEKALFAVASTKEITDIETLSKAVIFARNVQIVKENKEVVDAMLAGDAVMIIEGFDKCIVLDAKAWDKRSIMEPPVENVLRGPREGFIEDVKTNLQLLQRRLRTTKLKVERMRIGTCSNTAIAIVYLENVANPKIVKEIKERLKKINIDMLYDSASLEPFLEHRPLSIFRQVGYTERPDIAASKISEGRVAIVVDGSPIVLTLPYLLIEDFHSAQDHYQKFHAATFLRFLRLAALFIALLLPGSYVSLLKFNYDLVPLGFLVTIMNATKGTPLPPLFEVLLVIVLFEILRESALRLPKIIGLAMGIVGGIILGEAAILSGLLSPSTVLVVAISSIAMFTVPSHLSASMLLRVGITLIAGLLGLFGMLLIGIFLLHYLSDLSMYEAPYLAPIAPLIKSEVGDSFIKKPLFDLKDRPESTGCINKLRQSDEKADN